MSDPQTLDQAHPNEPGFSPADVESLPGVFSSNEEMPVTTAPSAEAELVRLKALINTPELDDFLRAVHLEAIHQIERWGTASDLAKRPADWFWLVGYLAGKALHAVLAGDKDKGRHHCISTAAALYNWHCAISGTHVQMCPGRSDIASIVDASFPNEVGGHG